MSQLFQELKRRNVFRVAIAYLAVAWLIIQVADVVLDNITAPVWVMQVLMLFLAIGFPVAILFAWAYEMTPEGIKRESEVDRNTSITPQTGQKLNRMIIAVLVAAVAILLVDKFMLRGADAPQTVSVEDKSVAVLPFVAMSSGPDDEYFADGLTEEILNSLAQLPELLVTARTSAFSFKGQDIPVQEIASALGVKHIVEGSVRRSGERLRVTAQLIRADDGFHLWSENYDSSSTDAIAVQEKIAEQIASALDVVLDESKREAMREAGLRDVEAFTIYQKALEVFDQAHGEIGTIVGLRQANVLLEQVIERVPDFSQVYIDHSDLFIHLMSADAGGFRGPDVTDEDLASAYAAAIADYEAAGRYARTPEQTRFAELDLAFISGNWRGLKGRIENALDEPGCHEGNWTPVIADVFGYSERNLEHYKRILTCDPRRSLSWFVTARSHLRSGDKTAALRVAREGMEIAPGGWLGTELVRALVANDLNEEARQALDDHAQNAQIALSFNALIAAHENDRGLFEQLLEQFMAEVGEEYFWPLIVNAWGGKREEANRLAAIIDQHYFGAPTLTQITLWCGCGAPWDLDSTPNFAAKLREGNLTWPPQPTMEFPLKDW